MIALVCCWIAVLSEIVIFLTAHPQCLDFRPPFETKNELLFCSEYSDFGCCSQKRDYSLANKYEYILHHIKRAGLHHCIDMFKDIMCQECSPYAAHIYDAEVTQIQKPFPGLCQNYCNKLYSECSDIVQYLTKSKKIITALQNVNNFCDAVSLTDVDYCYPELLSNNVLNGDISRKAITQEGCLCLEEFATDLRNPLLLESPPDDTGRLFIAEQIGVIYVFHKNKTKIEMPFMNLTESVLTSSSIGDERGFLGLAFHPKFEKNQKLYVYYSVQEIFNEEFEDFYLQKVRISEFKVSRYDSNLVDMKSERILLEIFEPYWNHNGGEILFGADGYLYCFVGDGGAGGDPHGYAQNKTVLLGKVLRIDVDSKPDKGKQYQVPKDNPFIDEPGSRPEIYAYGVRNIWRCDVDEGDHITGYGTGRIICGDVGQNAHEEIDVIEKGGNYGWNSREGFACFKNKTCGNIGPEVLPIYTYPHSVGKSVTGGHVYRGCMNPNLNGKYIYGDYTNGKLFYLEENIKTGKWNNKDLKLCGTDVCFNGLTSEYGRNILSFGEDEDGEIYMLTTKVSSTAKKKGTVYKFVDPRRRGDPTNCRSNKHEPGAVASKASIPFGNNGWKFSWMPVTTCIMMPAWKCYHFYL